MFSNACKPPVARLPGVILTLLLTFLWSSAPWAQQRDPMMSLDHTVLDESLEEYRLERFDVASADAERHWRVTLAIPTTPAPEAGFPAFWMLDGNAALMEFDTDLLKELALQETPPVLVFLGYANDLRIDPTRTRDYTFAALEDDDAETPPSRRGGGANAFLEVIERQIRPEIARRVNTDATQQTLWGHSLGGLFVLHTLYTRPGAFGTYAAGSPALWWAEGALLGEPEQQFAANNAGRPARLLLSMGGGERARDTRHRDMSNPKVQAHLRRVTSVPPDSIPRLAERLQQLPGLEVSYREFPDLSHGLTFRASLMDALHQVVGITDYSNTRGTIR